MDAAQGAQSAQARQRKTGVGEHVAQERDGGGVVAFVEQTLSGVAIPAVRACQSRNQVVGARFAQFGGLSGLEICGNDFVDASAVVALLHVDDAESAVGAGDSLDWPEGGIAGDQKLAFLLLGRPLSDCG